VLLADYIVDFLHKQDVRNIFMLSGTGSVKLDDAFARKEGMKYVCARHEATAVIMAEASAKLKNKIGVAVVTTGPGGTNAIPGVVEAWVDSVPVFVLSGQVNSKHYIEDRAFGIQGFNIIDNVKKFTKYCAILKDPAEIKYHLERAMYEAFNGRPGPVWIDIPMDLQSAEINVNKLKGFTPPLIQKSDSKIDQYIDLLTNSKRPLVVFGRGVKLSNTEQELLQMLTRFNIPSISARMANDVFNYDNKYYFGMGGIRGRRAAAAIMKKSDLIISLGTSSCHTFFGEEDECVGKNAKHIVVNIDDYIFKRSDLNINLGIQSGLQDFFKALYNKDCEFDFTPWLSECKELKSINPMVTRDMKKNPINSYYLANLLSRITNSKHIFTNDAGSSNYISSQALNFTKGQKELTSGAFYTMGLTLPLAIGAAVEEPNKQIIAITGDGSIELNIQELQTISINDLNIKIIVINNGGYASIRNSQDAMCGGRYTDDSQILNFEKIATAFNLEFEIIEDVADLENKLINVFSTNKPTIVEVVCDDTQYMIQPTKEDLN
jgi:acetolactate synthase-1/2/3 large subunit